MGLANDVQSSNNPFGMPILAEYGREVSDVYVEITRKVIEHYRSLSILAAAGLPVEVGRHQVPSWVSDRSLRPRANLFMSPVSKQRFSACDRPANCRFTNDQRCLIASGVIHDKILTIGTPYAQRHSETNIITEWAELAGIHGHPKSGDIESFRLTLVGNFGQDGPLTEFELSSFFPWYENLYAKRFGTVMEFPPETRRAPPDSPVEVGRKIQRFSVLVHRASGWRRFFTTESGLMGIGPPTSAPGDFVCIVEVQLYP